MTVCLDFVCCTVCMISHFTTSYDIVRQTMRLRREAEALLAERKGEAKGTKKNGVGSKGGWVVRVNVDCRARKDSTQTPDHPPAAAASAAGRIPPSRLILSLATALFYVECLRQWCGTPQGRVKRSSLMRQRLRCLFTVQKSSRLHTLAGQQV